MFLFCSCFQPLNLITMDSEEQRVKQGFYVHRPEIFLRIGGMHEQGGLIRSKQILSLRIPHGVGEEFVLPSLRQ